ncbi:cell cycle checkpoint control protein RAD9A isoform X1 [Rattus norvegicus]|uniref:cell cycle checkpoint control protein RAD9A isoform X1 n=2 Tax=Rattus norvegicus TaxID=10116 RepID=UPI0003D0A24F|eukprot:XP_006230992.1 PREDICTED: cell cycle checkpoint control protein RAD9A isoform X1 [Rattus norvegicus]
MKCLITGGNVKVLGKAVHSLSRIGDELYLEPLKDGLSLRTVNSSRSAYACFLFAPLFFQQYQEASPGQDLLRCKILMKLCWASDGPGPTWDVELVHGSRVPGRCPTLPSPSCPSSALWQRWRRLWRSAASPSVAATATWWSSFTANMDCESLQAVFDPASCPHLLRTPARVLAEAVLSFPLALTEVTLGIGRGRRVILRSYQEEEADSTSKAMVTETSIGEEDFQQLHAPEGRAVTFCLKEFRGLLSFAESANLPLTIHFDVPGRPVIFTVEDSLLDAHFVLATLLEQDSCSQDLCSPKPHQPVPQKQPHSTPHSDDFTNDDIDCYMIAMETTVGNESSRAQPSTSLPPVPQASHDLAPPSEEEEEEAEPSTVPGTPPPKKFRSLFFGSILAPIHSPQGPNPVLAEDSDGEG